MKKDGKTRIRLIRTCGYCKHLWTSKCPIRVWGRSEGREQVKLDVDPKRDYCSKFERITQ